MNIKKLIFPIILVVILCGLIVGYMLMKSANDAASAETTEEIDESISVLSKDPAIPTKITLDNEQDTFSLSYTDDAWYWSDDDKYPIDVEKVTTIADALSEFTVETTVKDAGTDLTVYGLEEPYITATCEFSDGTSYTYKFGDINSFNSYRYCTLSGDSNVYMIDNTIIDILGVSLDDLFQNGDTPLIDNAIVADDVSKIVITTEGGQTAEITDEAGIEELYEYIYALNLSSWEDYYADSESMLNDYGISENGTRAQVIYTTEETVTNDDDTTSTVDVEHTYTVYIGHLFTNEDDTNGYFYTVGDSTIVYAADADTVDSIMEFLTYVPSEDTEDAEEITDETAEETEAEATEE